MDRRIVLGVLFAVLFAFTAFVNAEDKKEKGEKGGHGPNLFALVSKLDGLTDDQKTKIGKIKEETETALKAAKEAKDKEAGKKAFGTAREQLMAVLTDDQKAQLKKLVEENRPKGDKPKGDKPKADK